MSKTIMTDDRLIIVMIFISIGAFLLLHPRTGPNLSLTYRQQGAEKLIASLDDKQINMSKWWQTRDFLGFGFSIFNPDINRLPERDSITLAVQFKNEVLSTLDLAAPPNLFFSNNMNKAFQFDNFTARQANGYFFENGNLKSENWWVIIE